MLLTLQAHGSFMIANLTKISEIIFGYLTDFS